VLATGAWNPPDGHRVVAARLVWVLSPIAQAAGAFASAELIISVGPRDPGHPDVAVARGEPPANGHLERPADLIVVVGRDDPRAWLAAGTRTVWRLEADAVVEHSEAGSRRARGGVLRIPGVPGARVPLDALLAPPRPAAHRVPGALG